MASITSNAGLAWAAAAVKSLMQPEQQQQPAQEPVKAKREEYEVRGDTTFVKPRIGWRRP